VIGMGVSRFAFLLFAAAPAAQAAAPPQQKAGEWQDVEITDRDGIPSVGTQCFAGQSIVAKFNTMPHCSRKEVHTSGDLTTANARCSFQGSIMSWHEKALRLDDNNFYRSLHVTFSPPAVVYSLLGTPETTIVKSEGIYFGHLKWLGPCRPDERPLKY
jgi:hypothetical protein